jgi:hypothetical protein
MPIKQFVLKALSHGFVASGLKGRVKAKRIVLARCTPAEESKQRGRPQPPSFAASAARGSIVVVARHRRVAQCDVAVRLFPRCPVAIDFPRRPIAIGFPRRDIAVGLAARRAIAARTVAPALLATLGAKLTIALAASGAASRPTPVSPVGEPTLPRRAAA